MPTPKPRAAKSTAKAKHTADIAAAESREGEALKPPKRGRGRPRKDQNPVPPTKMDQPEGSDDEEDMPEDGKEGGVDIDWTKDLTWGLVTAIEEDDAIRRGLFPPPGSTKRNGGHPKKYFQWLLAKTLFEHHPQYAETFKKALDGKAKQQKPWWGKIKNRVKVLTDKAQAHIEMMGQTGAGLESADEILPDTPLHTKWDEIKEDSPWFWHMRSLIGERPNLRPVGIGNNGDDMDTSILFPSASDNDHTRTSSPETTDFFDHFAGTGTEIDQHDLYKLSDEEDSGDDGSVKRGKRKRASSSPPPTRPKKTKPQPALSTPAPASKPTQLRSQALRRNESMLLLWRRRKQRSKHSR
ncbi:hypothetical protein B0H17DRAFT_1217339 [Mycena rosella]|uniref:Uncharacterized protein n=1 Tax=Mycena rosella TaxID=1033263 RepID=A0AAD7FRR8_MYCRO|nr:hypothetical protein B0H17DRAFT_1217339 [Mycena rosella]